MRIQTEEIRRRIVDAAYESFWRLGFRRSSVDSIAARAAIESTLDLLNPWRQNDS